MVLILFAFAPVNDLVNLLLCGLAVVFFRKPERDPRVRRSSSPPRSWHSCWRRFIFRAANMWLPAEKIVLRGQLAVVGYVLAADPRYATVLRAADATVQILQLDDVESRTIGRLNPGLESAFLVRYLAGSASKRTPPC
jgi:hypothetical protein